MSNLLKGDEFKILGVGVKINTNYEIIPVQNKDRNFVNLLNELYILLTPIFTNNACFIKEKIIFEKRLEILLHSLRGMRWKNARKRIALFSPPKELRNSLCLSSVYQIKMTNIKEIRRFYVEVSLQCQKSKICPVVRVYDKKLEKVRNGGILKYFKKIILSSSSLKFKKAVLIIGKTSYTAVLKHKYVSFRFKSNSFKKLIKILKEFLLCPHYYNNN